MARGRNSKQDNNSIIAVSMDELFANCETILDSVYMSILLGPSLFVFQNFSFIILFFLILCDKFSFINMTDRLRHQSEKKHSPVSWFLILSQCFSHSIIERNENCVYKCIFQFPRICNVLNFMFISYL